MDISGATWTCKPWDGSAMFRVFIRQNTNFIENFSIGLLYHTGDRMLRTIALVRYNGPHGETSPEPRWSLW